MRSFLVFFLAALIMLPADASARRGGRKKNKLTKEEAKVAALFSEKADFDGFWDWFAAFKDPQIKISLIDTTKAPVLRLLVSVLVADVDEMPGSTGVVGAVTAEKKGVRKLHSVQVFLGRDDEELKPIATFQEETEADAGESTVTGRRIVKDDGLPPLEYVIIAPGHTGMKDVVGLNAANIKAVTALLGDELAGKKNIIWYGPALHTYRSIPGLSGGLSRFDEEWGLCTMERRRERIGEARAKEDEEAPKAAATACGLHDSIEAEWIEDIPYRGRHSRLFALPWDRRDSGLDSCTKKSFSSTELRFQDVHELPERSRDRGAFEEALRLLLRYGKPDSRKVIIILGDGRDGFLDDKRVCQEHFATEKKFCGDKIPNLRGKTRAERRKLSTAARKKLKACVQGFLNKRTTRAQEYFKLRSKKWLALLHSAHIRVFSIAYAMSAPGGFPLSQVSDRERLELLSQKSGGTYREIPLVDWISPSVTSLRDELNSEFILELDTNLESEALYKVQVKADLTYIRDNGDQRVQARGLITSTEIAFRVPFIGSGLWFWLQTKSQWLKEKVGPIWYWVIVVALALMLLLLLWLVFKLFKALIKKIIKAVSNKGKAVSNKGKAVSNKGKAAAKGAAKGAKNG